MEIDAIVLIYMVKPLIFTDSQSVIFLLLHLFHQNSIIFEEIPAQNRLVGAIWVIQFGLCGLFCI